MTERTAENAVAAICVVLLLLGIFSAVALILKVLEII